MRPGYHVMRIWLHLGQSFGLSKLPGIVVQIVATSATAFLVSWFEPQITGCDELMPVADLDSPHVQACLSLALKG